MADGSPRRAPIEALILAISHSKASALANESMQDVIAEQSGEIVHDDEIDLNPVWQLLSGQPEFEPDALRAALARFKTWEPRLGGKVIMPTGMAKLTDQQINELAAGVHVPPAELARLWRGGITSKVDQLERPVTSKQKALPRPAERLPTGTQERLRRRKLTPSQRRTVQIGCGLIAAAAFGFAGLTLVRGFRGASWESVSDDFAGEIPIKDVERLGVEVGGTLSDEGWLSQPAATRTAQMQAALEALPDDAQVFFVKDKAGTIRASARWYGKARQVSVTLR